MTMNSNKRRERMTESTGYAIALILFCGLCVLSAIVVELSKAANELHRIKCYLESGVIDVRDYNG